MRNEQKKKIDERQSRLSHIRLTEVLSYDPNTGIFIWLVANSNRVKVGTQAGWICKGTRIISIDGTKFMAHRLAWFYVKGKWPDLGLDHRDLDGANNIFSNLREATQAQNVCNVKVRRHSKSGVKGAHWHKAANSWFSQIAVDKKTIYLGLFDTVEAAAAAYAEASVKYHGEFGRAA